MPKQTPEGRPIAEAGCQQTPGGRPKGEGPDGPRQRRGPRMGPRANRQSFFSILAVFFRLSMYA